MLLLDRYNDPMRTVYYISARVYEVLAQRPNASIDELYKESCTLAPDETVGFDFFVMALDFLFLLGVVESGEGDGLCVHEFTAD